MEGQCKNKKAKLWNIFSLYVLQNYIATLKKKIETQIAVFETIVKIDSQTDFNNHFMIVKATEQHGNCLRITHAFRNSVETKFKAQIFNSVSIKRENKNIGSICKSAKEVKQNLSAIIRNTNFWAISFLIETACVTISKWGR